MLSHPNNLIQSSLKKNKDLAKNIYSTVQNNVGLIINKVTITEKGSCNGRSFIVDYNDYSIYKCLM
jgi:hypothetical protein